VLVAVVDVASWVGAGRRVTGSGRLRQTGCSLQAAAADASAHAAAAAAATAARQRQERILFRDLQIHDVFIVRGSRVDQNHHG